uniref:MFS domain-containing protein n=1 Tax=Steinernema glaseri TaxID=37863 RepID=A0A1I7YTJ1_9BILA
MVTADHIDPSLRKSPKMTAVDAPPLFSPKSVRLRMALLMMFGLTCTVAIRSNLGVTVVCMVNSTLVQSPERWTPNSSDAEQCPAASGKRIEEFGYDGSLPWDLHTQGLMFTAISIGSFVALLPAGYCADRYSPRMIISSCIIISALITYASPWLAELSIYGFIASRFLLGCAYAFIMPSLTAIASRWFVPDERSTLSAIHTSGVQIGGVFLGLVTPPLCSFKDIGGWPNVYYLCATLALLWSLLWLCSSSNFPEQNRSISDHEQCYISERIVAKRGQKKRMFPWRAAFSSPPFLAVLFARVSLITQQYIMTFYAASFIRDVLKSDLRSNGFFTTLPYVANFIAKLAVSGLADLLKQKRVLSHNSSTKLFQTTANFGNAFCFAALALVADCHHVFLAVVLMTTQAVFTSCVSPGLHTSALSIAPLHAGSVQSVTMFVANIFSSAAPTFISAILVHNTPDEWSIVFFTIAAMNVFTGVFFAVFGSANAQEWSKPRRTGGVTPNS